MANQSIYAAFERMWQHILAIVSGKANSSHTHEEYETAENATQKLNEAKEYTNSKVADLVNSAPEMLDTLGELAEAFENNQEMTEVLNQAISDKVDKTDIITIEQIDTLFN